MRPGCFEAPRPDSRHLRGLLSHDQAIGGHVPRHWFLAEARTFIRPPGTRRYRPPCAARSLWPRRRDQIPRRCRTRSAPLRRADVVVSVTAVHAVVAGRAATRALVAVHRARDGHTAGQVQRHRHRDEQKERPLHPPTTPFSAWEVASQPEQYSGLAVRHAPLQAAHLGTLMCAAMFFTLLQDPSGGRTTGLEGAVDNTVQDTGQEISRAQEFFAEVYGYLISTDFLANVIASVLVILSGLFAYRVLTHGLPRVLRWRRRRAEDLLDAEAVARMKRQDTAITLVRNE